MRPFDLLLFLILRSMIAKERVTDIFFDLDHTLWDFEANSAATFDNILPAYKFNFSTKEFMSVYTPINHRLWKLYRENKLTSDELRFNRLEQTFEQLKQHIEQKAIHSIAQAYIDQLSTHTHLFEGTHALLKYLNERYRLHIITNGFENVQQKKMENSGIREYFEVILTAEKAGVKKPNPQIFKQATILADVTPNAALMIGDSFEADILGALNAGMQAIHFNSHNEPKHAHCPIIDQLNTIHQYL